MLTALDQLNTEVDKDAYHNQVVIMDEYVTDVEVYQQDFDDIVTALQQNGGNIAGLSTTLKADLEAMVSGGTGSLQWAINEISGAELGGSSGADGMAQLFAKVLTDELGYDPYETHIFPAAFVNGAYAQIGYYAGVVDQAAYLYSNAAHLKFSAGSYHHPADPNSVVGLVNAAQADLQAWSVAFSDGPVGDGTPAWVSQGTDQAIGGPLPAGTVLDYRVQSQPMLWTDAPVALDGYPTSPPPYYCATTAQNCYADLYSDAAAGDVASTSLVLPSPEDLPTMIADEGYQGLSGWRIPTSTDWADLEAGATGGLSSWGEAHQLDMFAPQQVTSYYGGKQATVTAIAPVLVDTGAVQNGRRYGLLTSTDPTSDSLTLEEPYLGNYGDNDQAGRLFLVMDFQPTTVPVPFSPPASQTLTKVTTHHGGATKSHEGAVRPARKPGRARSPETKALGAAGPTTFTTPVACADLNSADYYTVPAGVASVQVTAAGGPGAASTIKGTAASAGGLGGVASATVPVTPGEILYVQVGGAAHGTAGGLGGGGNGGPSTSEESGDASGGGGGASGVSTTSNCSHWLVVAGGGGGGGGSVALYLNDHRTPLEGGRGGDGCSLTSSPCNAATAGSKASSRTLDDGLGSVGGAGSAAPDNQGGAGGTNPKSGGAGSGSAGAGFIGGVGGDAARGTQGGGGGGGGAGYYGGGGGGGAGFDAAGGGGAGGASFSIPGATDVSYGVASPGQNGSVTITPVANAPAPISLSVASANVSWGQPVVLTATLPADATGSVGFYDDVNGGCESSTAPGAVCQGLGVAPIEDGQATLSNVTAPLGVGTHYLHASYGGDTHFLPKSSDPVTVIVSKATPQLGLSVSGTVFPVGQAPASLVVQLPPAATGSVGFYDSALPGPTRASASPPSRTVTPR